MRETRARLLALLLVLLILAPRLPRLGQFVTPDERKWLARSANFYYALAHGDFANTFQREHPGVTVMWAGTLGFLARYPSYVREAPGYFGWKDEEIEPFLRQRGYNPLDLLVAGRLFVVLFVTGALLLAFLYARRVLGDGPAALGLSLVALSPFHVGLSRLLHLDALLSAFMLASLMALLAYLFAGRRWHDLVVSGALAGLAWLTKSPGLFLVPVAGLAMLWEAWRRERNVGAAFHQALREGVLWGGTGMLVAVALWPALWVAPRASVARVLFQTLDYASKGHVNPLYFMGRVYVHEDPGLLFYPVNYFWRETPVVLFGLVLAFWLWAKRKPPFDNTTVRMVAGWLLISAVGFGLIMTVGIKKFDRYLLPAFPPLALLAAFGWQGGLWLLYPRHARWALAVVAAVVLAQGFEVWRTAPYYLSYYSPLLGGSRFAPRVLLVGWGEGLDEAARYLNTKPEAEKLRVASWYGDGPFSYYFVGLVEEIPFESGWEELFQWLALDYVVTYINQWQRRLPSPEIVDFLETIPPEHVITVDGIEYARIYDVRHIVPPEELIPGRPRLTDWGGRIRLVAYKMPTHVKPGEKFLATFYLQNIAPIEQDLNVLVRIVGPGNVELLRDEGWPWGAPTSTWQWREIWPDGHEFTVPPNAPPGPYRVELSFYDPKTLQPLPAVDVKSNKPIGTTLVVDILEIGSLPAPRQAFTPPPLFDKLAVLEGWDLITAEGLPLKRTQPGEMVRVRLHWKAQGTSSKPYKGFVHLLSPDGTLVTQDDQQPLEGFLPTPLWRSGLRLIDEYELSLPETLPPGTYTLTTGLYDEETLQRLPVFVEGKLVGDSVVLGTLEVEKP